MSVDKEFEEIFAEVLNKDNIYKKLNDRTELILIFLSANTGTITGGFDVRKEHYDAAEDDPDGYRLPHYIGRRAIDIERQRPNNSIDVILEKRKIENTPVNFNNKNLIIPLPIISINIIDEYQKNNSITIDALLKKLPKISENITITREKYLEKVKIISQNNKYYAILSFTYNNNNIIYKNINDNNLISNYIDNYEQNIQQIKTIMELFIAYDLNIEQLIERDKRIQDDLFIKINKNIKKTQDEWIRQIKYIIILFKEKNNNYNFFTPLLMKFEIINTSDTYNTLLIITEINKYYKEYNINLDKIDTGIFLNKLKENIYTYNNINYGVINIEYNKTTDDVVLYTNAINIKKIIEISNTIYKVYDDISSKITSL